MAKSAESRPVVTWTASMPGRTCFDRFCVESATSITGMPRARATAIASRVTGHASASMKRVVMRRL